MTTKNITTDLLSGVVVGVILVPTAIAYGIIAGVGPASGLYRRYRYRPAGGDNRRHARPYLRA